MNSRKQLIWGYLRTSEIFNCHEKKKFISSSHRIIFFLLYRRECFIMPFFHSCTSTAANLEVTSFMGFTALFYNGSRQIKTIRFHIFDLAWLYLVSKNIENDCLQPLWLYGWTNVPLPAVSQCHLIIMLVLIVVKCVPFCIWGRSRYRADERYTNVGIIMNNHILQDIEKSILLGTECLISWTDRKPSEFHWCTSSRSAQCFIHCDWPWHWEHISDNYQLPNVAVSCK